MDDSAVKRLDRYQALYSEHFHAARFSRQLTDDAFTALLQSGDSVLTQDATDRQAEVRRRIFDDMAHLIRQLVFSASGAHTAEFTVPFAAGYLLDAIRAYLLLQTETMPDMSAVADSTRHAFRSRMNADVAGCEESTDGP